VYSSGRAEREEAAAAAMERTQASKRSRVRKAVQRTFAPEFGEGWLEEELGR
jgi:hypothetical protein